MMFLVRSTFWFGIVLWHMPLDHGQALRVVEQTQGAIVANAVDEIKGKCAQEPASCGAILATAAGVALAPSVPRRAPRAAGIAARQKSANSLDAADLTTPWRGRSSKFGA